MAARELVGGGGSVRASEREVQGRGWGRGRVRQASREEAWRAPERPRPPPASHWPPPASSSTPRRRHAPPCLSPSLSRVLILSPGLLSHSPERSRRHRRAPSRPPPPPSLADALKGFASTPSFSPPSHKAPDVPQHRPRCLLQPRDRRPSSSNSSAPDRPRPRRASPRHRREPLTFSPNSACSPPCRSTVPHEHRSHRPPLLLHA